jgi:DoxX-like family
MKQNIVMTVFGWIFTALIGGGLIASAALKLAQPKFVTEGFAKSGFPDGTLVPIGIAELISALLFLFPKTRVLGAVLVTGYMGGAIATHVHGGESIVVQILFGVFAWLGLYLRDARIRSILPLWSADSSDSLK